MRGKESLLVVNPSRVSLQEAFRKSPKGSPELNTEINDVIATKVLSKMDSPHEEEVEKAYILLSGLDSLLKKRIINVVSKTLTTDAWTVPSLEDQQLEAGVTLLFPRS